MKKLLFIYNPQAGKGQVRPQLAAILDAFSKAGYLTSAWPTQGPGDATRVAAAIGRRYDRVVCCGGDGTLNEVVTSLMGLEAPPLVGYIPAGTTNDFSRNLDLPKGMDKAAEAAVAGVARPCDIGVFNDRFFVYVAAFGAFTDVSYDTPQPFKNTFGHLAYLLEGATKLGSLLKGYHLTIEHDGGAVEGDFIYGMVSNTISVGGFQLFPPERVALDDGLFEVVLVRLPRNPAEFQSALRSLTRQNTVESDMIVALHTSRLRVVTQEELTWTLDGEYGGAPETVEIQNRQKALTLIWGK